MFLTHAYVKGESTLVRETQQERKWSGRNHVDKQHDRMRPSLDVDNSSGNSNAVQCTNRMSGKSEWWRAGRKLYALEGSPNGAIKTNFAAD